MAIILIEVNPVAYDKDVIYFGSKIIRLHLNLSASLFIQKGAYFYGMRTCKGETILQELEGPAAIDDVLDNKNIFSFNRDFNILGDFNDARGFHLRPVAGQPDKINFDGDLEMSDQIGKKHEGTFQDADQHQFFSVIILRDLIGQVLNDRSDPLLREQWVETISFHIYPVRKPYPFGRNVPRPAQAG
jgi:hypothetical protein